MGDGVGAGWRARPGDKRAGAVYVAPPEGGSRTARAKARSARQSAGSERSATMAENPYSSLPDHRFWRKAVTSLPPFALDPIIRTPFKISPDDKVATGGSCFAQEIAMRLQASGFHYYLAEQPPAGMSASEALHRNYSMYSCRYGNLYTTAQFLQLIERVYGRFKPQLDYWNRPEDGRFVDPFRPRIEPDGYATLEEMRADRERHFAAVRHMLETMDVFVFTFGHTETWRHKPDGAILQLAPGVAGGEWDPNVFEFYNMTVSEVVRDFLAAIDRIREVNPNIRIVLSVSPVGIIATYEDRHVIESNSAVKAILRAAADEVVRARPNIAYFPSYDLATVSPNVSMFYRDDTRRINPYGVDRAMQIFFDHFTDRQKEKEAVKALKIDVAAEAEDNARVVCDEEAIESA
jgi:PAS domain-containing protein